ncbi:MAG: hypothetical protein GYA87_00885, partial [Christensenellaceae bacterium]|nr:hypothetical protein [Christensenellaceae bacterium]
KATVKPANATNKKVEWTTSDKGIATVDDDGLVKGIKVGEATITVTTKDGENQVGKRYFFKTAPEKGGEFQFALLSDMQLKVKTKETVKFLGQQENDFIIFAGDLINTPWKVSEWFDVEGAYEAPGEEDRGFFDCLSQDDDNARLAQYMPIFYCPGNHEVDDQRVCFDKEMAQNPDSWNWSIYMQMFRPLYPEQDYTVNGKRYYSVDYGDLHISSINVHRWHSWDGFEFPGWITYDDISPDSPQAKWLQEDLANSDSKYKWVVMHWHMLNRGDDGYFPVSKAIADPSNPEKAIYPDGDYAWDVLRPLYETYNVDAVNFGHSHVYERYLINGVNYIEAASIGNNYRSSDDPYHPSGNMPIIEANQFRSIMVVKVDENGMNARGIQASMEDNGIGYIGRVFDSFNIAK